jgi:hypothetical protein
MSQNAVVSCNRRLLAPAIARTRLNIHLRSEDFVRIVLRGVIVSAVLTHLTGPFVERLDGPLAINSANGAGQENPGTLQRTAVAAWRNAGDASEDASQMMLVGKAARQCHLS